METVKIERLDDYGRGISYINNKICFVSDALIGEVVDIEIVKEKSKYLEAKVLNYKIKSPDRVKPLCKYYDVCGGCNTFHMSYDFENKFKYQKIVNIMKKFANIDSCLIRPIKYSNELYYRNKIRLHEVDGCKGLYNKDSSGVVEIDKCLIVSDRINKLLKDNLMIRVSNLDDSYLTEKSNFKIVTSLGDVKYYLSKDSFFQINRFLTKELFDDIKKMVLNINPVSLIDLYCGNGAIGIYICKDSNIKLIGVDYSKSNIEDAKDNLKLNNMNGEFICSRVEDVIDRFKSSDLVIVDPPRSGLDNKTKDNLKRISSKYIIYVSCDPITLARDIKDISDNYEVKSITPYNLFPKTYHVECLTLLCLKTF